MKNIFAALTLFFCLGTSAKVMVGEPNRGGFKGNPVDLDVMMTFKSRTTVFFYSEEDADFFNAYGDQLKEEWTITPLIFAPRKEARKYIKQPEKYNIFHRYSKMRIKWTSTCEPFVEFIHLYLNLYVNLQDERKCISSIILGPSAKEFDFLAENYITGLKSQSNCKALTSESARRIDIAQNRLATNGDILNLKPAYLKLFLKEISTKLEKRINTSVMDNVFDEEALGLLSEKTLIIPEEILYVFDRKTQSVLRQDEKDLLKKYDYKYKLKSDAAIQALLLDEKKNEDYYFLIPAIANTDKLFNIYKSDGTHVMSMARHFSREFSAKDFKKIGKQIRKSAKS